jgi:putative inorganic carbon (HCO3(-)) transporter
MTRESFPFWCLATYVMIEYVRPQQVWRSLDVLPWGKITLVFTLLAMLFAGVSGRRLQVLDKGLVFFTLVVLASSFTAFDPGAAQKDWTLFLNWILLYALASLIVTTPRRFFIFLVLFLLWSLKMSQHGTRTLVSRGFAFSDWGATGAPGWFHNSGEFAIQMCIFLPMSFHFMLALRDRIPKWWFWGGLALLPGTAALSIVASSSRGGQLAAGVVFLYLIGQFPRRRVKAFATIALLVPVLWFALPAEQKQRFYEMGEDDTSQSRITYWKHGLEMMMSHPVLGVGYNNWGPYYVRYYDPLGELPHNIFVEAGAEMGFLGLGAFVFLIGGTFVVNYRTRRLAAAVPRWGGMLKSMALGLDAALVGFLASGFFVTVLYYPFFWMNLAFTAALLETTRRARRQALAAEQNAKVHAARMARLEPAAIAPLGPDVEWRLP